ncbi:LacI family DNA-binding transcriptional regulator [Streptomyces sp. SID5910]|uniref:LacI family DNA-binding transcriptional regulator n=1 Tax=Streptomyces sp. SID5910 TaxID=2690312 RepID=UPI00136F6519|nr:LacI family DNA-binding transcriptional regulator [Streptomyces sp. SID5910]MYR46405.1 substrate-binding domain-containing protein [Streptomyces sp. SID5910]
MAKQTGKAPTLTDVARAAGTSTAVVSYVMNNGPRPVAAATRERVLAAAAELDYRPNHIARALRSRTTGVVGLILADASNPYFGALARHVEQALDKHGKLTLTGNAGYSADRQEHLADKFLSAQVDGLIVVSADGGADVADQVKRAGVPAVYVHNQPEDEGTPAVTADNEAAVQQAVAHLRGHGHTRIAFLAGPRDAGPVGRRRATWETALAGTGEAPLLRCAYSRAAAAALTGQLISEGTMPAALITATDEQAIGVLAAARTHKLPVPDRLAVISLDGTPDSAYTAPALTVTRQPLEAMAARAVDLLLGSEAAAPPTPHAPLVVRGSCGCATADS